MNNRLDLLRFSISKSYQIKCKRGLIGWENGTTVSVTRKIILLLILMNLSVHSRAQTTDFDQSQLGAWYMYFLSVGIKQGPFGFQGDFQFRNWNLLGDLEQLLLRGGFTYTPKGTQIKFTLGYASITTGTFGDGTKKTHENRIYQEALLPQKVGGRTYLTHRFRFEQRWVEGQDFRTRVRYAIFMNIALNQKALIKGTFYYAFYDELFINGQRDIGGGREVQVFDRNRFYNAIGYCILANLRIQGGYMYQSTDNWGKGQLQISLHHAF